MWPAMARMHNPQVGECLISKRALLCVLTKSATAARVSAVTDRPSRARFRKARIRCVRLQQDKALYGRRSLRVVPSNKG